MALILSLLTFVSTFLGGLFGLRYKNKLHLILGFTSGVLLSVVSFEIFPEIIKLVNELKINSLYPMLALIVGFLLFHIGEKLLLVHYSEEENYPLHHHPSVGLLAALALSTHSFLDGVGIGLGFQVSNAAGIVVAIAVIGHDFSDGLNTISVALTNKVEHKKSLLLLFIDAAAPLLGALSTLFFHVPDSVLLLYLGFFAGFLLYIGASEMLPEAHSEHSSIGTIAMTLLGVVFTFHITIMV